MTSFTSFVDGVFACSWAVASLPGVVPSCGSRLLSIAPLANPTFGSCARRSRPLARPGVTPTTGWDSSPLLRPNKVCDPGRVNPRPGRVLSVGRKPLARPTLGSSIAGGTLLRPRACSWGCWDCPRPKNGILSIKLRTKFGSIWGKKRMYA